MRKLDHPNIIKLWEVHESKNSIYLVIEYLTGGELFQKITDSGGKLSNDEIIKIMKYSFLKLIN